MVATCSKTLLYTIFKQNYAGWLELKREIAGKGADSESGAHLLLQGPKMFSGNKVIHCLGKYFAWPLRLI
jgi:hypothetical protein